MNVITGHTFGKRKVILPKSITTLNSPGNQNFVNLYRKPGVMTSEKHIIKVDAAITPIHYTKRTEPVLTVGADYYVCFGNNIAYPCTLKEIIEGRAKRVVITKYDNDQRFGEHVVFSNEIGQTPEEAVRNTATF